MISSIRRYKPENIIRSIGVQGFSNEDCEYSEGLAGEFVVVSADADYEAATKAIARWTGWSLLMPVIIQAVAANEKSGNLTELAQCMSDRGFREVRRLREELPFSVGCILLPNFDEEGGLVSPLERGVNKVILDQGEIQDRFVPRGRTGASYLESVKTSPSQFEFGWRAL